MRHLIRRSESACYSASALSAARLRSASRDFQNQQCVISSLVGSSNTPTMVAKEVLSIKNDSNEIEKAIICFPTHHRSNVIVCVVLPIGVESRRKYKPE